jgi:chemosensory pili system protein ChpE
MPGFFLSAFFLGIVFCAPPGIITAETVRRGVLHGFRSALLVQLGSLVGDSTWALVALTGLAFLIQTPFARVLLSLFGILLLLKLAYGALREAWKNVTLAAGPASQRGDFATGAVLSLGNPFNIIFWTGMGATAFAGLSVPPTFGHYATFYLAFLLGAVAWCFFLAGLVGWGRRFLTPLFFRWVNLLCGLALAWFAFQLGWQTIQSLIR